MPPQPAVDREWMAEGGGGRGGFVISGRLQLQLQLQSYRQLQLLHAGRSGEPAATEGRAPSAMGSSGSEANFARRRCAASADRASPAETLRGQTLLQLQLQGATGPGQEEQGPANGASAPTS
jgi:hypothetical protein